MRLFLIALIFMCGCATTIETLKPTNIYLLENNRKVTVYRTRNENIYVIDKDTFILGD